MNKGITIPYRAFFAAAYIYLALPILIFFLGYLKIYIGVICAAVLILSAVLAIRDCGKDPEGLLKEEKALSFPVKFLIIGAVTAIILTLVNGVGEYTWGPYDHAFRRAILNDLVEYKWPIIYDPATQTDPYVIQIMNLNGPQGFVYYFTYWLPSALIGKLFGFGAGNIFLVLWNSIGIFITFIGMSMYLKRATYASMFMYICFSGLDVIPLIVNDIRPYEGWFWIDGWVSHVSLISNFNNLENVYHQAVPCYLIIVLILLAKNNRSMGSIAAMIFAYSPWVTMGMIPVVFVRMFMKDLKAEKTSRQVRNIFTVGNLLLPAVLLIIYGLFYSAKSDSMHEHGFVWEFYGSVPKFLLVYVLLLAVEVLPAFIIVFKDQKKNPMFWAAIALLMICPVYKITESNDFTMRVSMPALFLLTIFVAKVVSGVAEEDLELARKGKKRKGAKAHLKLGALCLVLIGMAYVTYYMGSAIFAATFFGDREEWPDDDIVSFGNVAGPAYADKIEDQFFVEDPDNSPFFKYLAR